MTFTEYLVWIIGIIFLGPVAAAFMVAMFTFCVVVAFGAIAWFMDRLE